MNLADWQRLWVGDVIHWHDQLSGPFYLLIEPLGLPVREEPWKTWPNSWAIESVDPTVPATFNGTLDCGLRDGFLLADPRNPALIRAQKRALKAKICGEKSLETLTAAGAKEETV